MEIEAGQWYEVEGTGEVYVTAINGSFESFDTKRPQTPPPVSIHVRMCREVDGWGAMPPFLSLRVNEFGERAEKMSPQPEQPYRGDSSMDE
jgi:hypothetical protein